LAISKYLKPAAYARKIRLVVARILLRYGIPLNNFTKVDGLVVKFRATSFLEYFLRAEESYVREEVTMYWIRNYINPDDVVYDVGANVGAYSLLIGKIVQSGNGRVYAIEPESNNYSALNRNIVLNQLTDKVVAYAFAFGDSRRASKFFLSSGIVGSSDHSIDEPESDRNQFVPHHIQGVLLERLDDFVTYKGIEFPNHIKIDVDGVEKMIVCNMDGVLADQRLKTIMIEIETILSGGVIEEILSKHRFKEVMREQWGDRTIFNALYVRS